MSDFSATDEVWMRRALGLGRLAAQRGEVPIGCVVVRNGELLGSAHDSKETNWLPTGHAEILAIEEAAKRVGDWRLTDATLYVTVEPCPMCAGAIVHARIGRIVFGVPNPRWGACGSLVNIPGLDGINHKPQIESGLLAEECAELMRETFRKYRKNK